MSGRKTTEEFIATARKVHGDKYDYSQVDYQHAHAKVKIGCPLHGIFEQTASNHLKGARCGACFGKNQKTTNAFIAAAKEVHGNIYGYSLVDYKTRKLDVVITCPIHGPFLQTPARHLRGSGCKKCGIKTNAKKRTYKASQFIAKARAIHGDTFDYSQVCYVSSTTPVEIICREHGVFMQTPSLHFNTTHCCPGCAPNTQVGTDVFIERAIAVHGNTYRYTEVNYVSANKKVAIKCSKHGIFLQTPSSHLRGDGCPECSTTKKLTSQEFVERAKQVHGSKYDYSLVKYVNINKKVKVVCSKHGVFRQEPASHINKKSGCPKCNASKGENKIEAFLNRKGISYEGQKRFPECRGKKYPLPFDFFIPALNILIEYDGEHHFFPVRSNGTVSDFQQIQKRDRIKNKFAVENGYKLLRIPFTEFDRIEDILTEALNPDAELNKGLQLTFFC